MLDLANISMKATKASINQKTIKMKKAKKEFEDLKKLPEGERGDVTNCTQRVQEAKDKLQGMTNDHVEKKNASPFFGSISPSRCASCLLVLHKVQCKHPPCSVQGAGSQFARCRVALGKVQGCSEQVNNCEKASVTISILCKKFLTQPAGTKTQKSDQNVNTNHVICSCI